MKFLIVMIAILACLRLAATCSSSDDRNEATTISTTTNDNEISTTTKDDNKICQFKQGTTIYGSFDRLELQNNKEDCASQVMDKYPSATGVIWKESKECYATYGNRISPYPMDDYWACLVIDQPYWEFTGYGRCQSNYMEPWTRTQLECQNRCIGDPDCVGISFYSYWGYSNCYICHTEVLALDASVFYKRPGFCLQDTDCSPDTPVCNQYGYCYECDVDDSGCSDPFLSHCLNGFCAECRDDHDCSTSAPLCSSGKCSPDVTYTQLSNASCDGYYLYFFAEPYSIEIAQDVCLHDSQCGGVTSMSSACNPMYYMYLCPTGSIKYNEYSSYCIFNKTMTPSIHENIIN